MHNGNPPDIDDLSISNDELLYIRIYPDPDALVWDPSTLSHRPNSGCLKDTRGPLSVDLSSKCTPQDTQAGCTTVRFHVAAVKAGVARRYNCRIVRDPVTEESGEPPNPAHALIFGDHENESGALRYKSQAKKIALEATIILYGDQLPPH